MVQKVAGLIDTSACCVLGGSIDDYVSKNGTGRRSTGVPRRCRCRRGRWKCQTTTNGPEPPAILPVEIGCIRDCCLPAKCGCLVPFWGQGGEV